MEQKKEKIQTKKASLQQLSEVNRSMVVRAHQHLESLCGDAEQCRLWGTVGIQIAFEDGVAKSLHRRLDGRDKS